MRLMTLFWGAFDSIFLVIHVPLVLILPIPLVIVETSIAGVIFFLVNIGGTTFYVRRIVKRLDEIKKMDNDLLDGETGRSLLMTKS